MTANRHTEITFETHETTVIRFNRGESTFFCQSCQQRTAHLSIAQVELLLAISASAIAGLVQAKRIHITGAADGSSVVCGNSLAAISRG